LVRQVLLRDGDLVTASSERTDETLVHFLVARGDLGPDAAAIRAARLPQSGRHAAAALIANGFLSQDDLWPVLRAHAEWTITQALRDERVMCKLERHPAERLLAEPNVFGGAAGVEVFVELVRRVVSHDQAVAMLGGPDATIAESEHGYLLAESALATHELDAVQAAIGVSVNKLLTVHGPEIAALLYALTTLQILSSTAPPRRHEPESERERFDPLDADAIRQRVAARVALVREADYFSLLGIPRRATSYEVRHAFVTLRRSLEPNRLLTAATADLRADVELVIEVLEEAYEVLRDANRRTRYRKAIEATSEA